MSRWRYITPTKRQGRWYPTLHEAQVAAFRAGLGNFNNYADKAGRKQFYANPFVELESDDGPL